MTPAELSRAVLTTVRRAVAAEELRVVVPEKIVVQRPPRPGCGDYATNVALQLAGQTGATPYQVAEILSRRLMKEPGIAQVEIAGPGFMNITLDATAYGDVVRQVRAQGAEYGHGDGLADETVSVAAEPGDVRGTLVAEVVARLARAAGARPPAPGEKGEPLIVAPAPEPVTVTGTGTTPHPPLGPDEIRWGLLRPPAEDVPRLTDHLLAQRESNPLFRIRYAHARTRALLRNAHDLGVDPDPETGPGTAPGTATAPRPAHDLGVDPGTSQDPSPSPSPTADTGRLPGHPHPAPDAPPDTLPDDPLYHHPAETELLGLIADFPRVIETAARRRAPDRLARHLQRLADAFFRFHDECPPLPRGDEKPSAVHAARIRLADATGIVLADGLHLLGISAPDHL